MAVCRCDITSPPCCAELRCKQQLIMVGRLSLALKHPNTLIGKLAAFCEQHHLVVPEHAELTARALVRPTWRPGLRA